MKPKWGYLRIVRLSGGVRVSPIHTHPRCQHLNRGYVDDETVETVRVLISTLEGHPILGGLRICQWCADPVAVTRRALTTKAASAGVRI